MCAVEAAVNVHKVEVAHVSMEIINDSAAEALVCWQKWARAFEPQVADRSLKLVNASGGPIKHFGKRAVSFSLEHGEGRKVTNVRKPFMAGARVMDVGNLVRFAPCLGGGSFLKARRLGS